MKTAKSAKSNSVNQKVKQSKEALMKSLCATLKVDDAIVLKIAQSEKRLMQLKADKLSSKCKVERQRARNLKFFRHEHTAETIADIQSLSAFV